MTYGTGSSSERPLVWLHGAIQTPPFSRAARLEAGEMLRRLQRGEMLAPPHSRPLPELGKRCHELRIRSAEGNWRIIYRLDVDAVVIAEVFNKKVQRLAGIVLDACRARLRRYDRLTEEL